MAEMLTSDRKKDKLEARVFARRAVFHRCPPGLRNAGKIACAFCASARLRPAVSLILVQSHRTGVTLGKWKMRATSEASLSPGRLPTAIFSRWLPFVTKIENLAFGPQLSRSCIS